MAQFNNDEDYDFSSPQHFSDLVLVVENTEFHVHKCVLSMSSPVFERMLTSGFREKNLSIIPLPSQRREEFGAFLRVIYSDFISQGNQINETNYESLLKLADEYEVVKVKKLCCKFLISTIKESNCLTICKLAEEYSLDENVVKMCTEVASLIPGSVLGSSEEFIALKDESRQRIRDKMAKNFAESMERIPCSIKESDR